MPFLGKTHLMNIILNGQNKKIDDNTNIEKLLISLGLNNKRLAVEVNQEIIPRADFDKFALSELDKVEIVQAIGGGSYPL
jgi:thiamine biosynthesis protein ThiS